MLSTKQDYIDYINSLNYEHIINVDIKIPQPYYIEITLTVPFWYPFCFGKEFKEDLYNKLNRYKLIYFPISHVIKFKNK